MSKADSVRRLQNSYTFRNSIAGVNREVLKFKAVRVWVTVMK